MATTLSSLNSIHNMNMTWMDPSITTGTTTQQYNFPFKVSYMNKEWVCDFFFGASDYASQEDMMRARTDHCSQHLFAHFIGVFEQLQEICLDDTVEASDALVDRINELFNVLLHLYAVQSQMHHLDNGVPAKLKALFGELTEMFLLLEDYYTIARKKELYAWKKKVECVTAECLF